MISLRYLHDRPVFLSRDLSVRGIGIHETMPPSQIARPTGTGDFLFMLFHSVVDFGPPGARRVLPPGSIVFWTRGAAQHYGSERGRWSHSWLHCDGKNVGEILATAKAVVNEPLRVPDSSVVENLLYDLYREITEEESPDPAIVRNDIENLVRKAASQTRVRRRPVPEALLAIKSRLDHQYDQPISLSALAESACWSPRHFCTQFRRHFGVAPVAYLINRRLHAAAALLRGTALDVGEVGRRVGYPDRYYFSRHFKAHFGVTPSALRSDRGS